MNSSEHNSQDLTDKSKTPLNQEENENLTKPQENENPIINTSTRSNDKITRSSFISTRNEKKDRFAWETRIDLSDTSISIEQIKAILLYIDPISLQFDREPYRNITITDERNHETNSVTLDVFNSLEKSAVISLKNISAYWVFGNKNDHISIDVHFMIYSKQCTIYISCLSEVWLKDISGQIENYANKWVLFYEEENKGVKLNQKEFSVNEKREMAVSDVIITSDDIRVIARTIDGIYQKINPTNRPSRNFVIKSYDNSISSSSSVDIFTEGGILDTKQIKSFSIEIGSQFRDDKYSISVKISQEKEYGGNRISIGGNNVSWVNDVTKQIQELMSGWKKQSKWYQYVCVISFVAFFIILLEKVRQFTTSQFFNELESKYFILFLIWISFSFASQLFVLVITRSFSSLWPAIELETGREHQRVFSLRKSRIIATIMLVILPILTNFLYDLFKRFFGF